MSTLLLNSENLPQRNRTESASTTNPVLTQEVNQEEIAKLAYTLWLNRGCPVGSAEEDWGEAEKQLAGAPSKVAAATAGN